MIEPKYPEYVPRLTEDDLCRKKFSSGNRRCVQGWINEAVYGSPYGALIGPQVLWWDTARANAVEVLYQAFNKEASRMGLSGYRTPHTYNDNRENSLEDIAKAFNSAMTKLGFTEESDR